MSTELINGEKSKGQLQAREGPSGDGSFLAALNRMQGVTHA